LFIKVSLNSGQKDMHSNPQRAAFGIGWSLDAVSGPWLVILLDARVLVIAMHLLASVLLPVHYRFFIIYRLGTFDGEALLEMACRRSRGDPLAMDRPLGV
jgi:hypothetical protein